VAPPTVPGAWSKIAAENDAFTVSAETVVRYGAGNTWIYSKGSGVATNEYFGKDPAYNVVKVVEAFTPVVAASPVVAPPVVKPGKATTPSNTKLKSMKGLTASFFDPAKLTQVKSFTGVTANSKGAFSIADVALVPGVAYAVLVTDASGKVLDVMYPVTAQ
jgi:hypothetical protein